MIKQLQLRGISRVPSDRMSADGGCAESLNVHLDQGETAPTLPPEDMTDYVYGSASTRLPIVYIHKMPNAVCYIGCGSTSPTSGVKTFRAYVHYYSGSTEVVDLDTMGSVTFNIVSAPEKLQHVISIGNTLIAFTDKTPYYFLFKDNAYSYLGNAIPRPVLEVGCINRDNPMGMSFEIEEDELQTDSPAIWNMDNKPSSGMYPTILGIINKLWETATLALSSARDSGWFGAPFFIRYALRLYDGKYIYASSPILCGGGKTDVWLDSYVSGSTTTQQRYSVSVSLPNVFKVFIKGSYSAGNWSDIVKSIDIFASSPIYAPAMESKMYEMDSSSHFVFEGMSSESKDDTILNEVLSKGQFYKIMTFSLEDVAKMGELQNGELEIINTTTISGELLFEQETMPESYRDSSQYLPGAEALNYNKRLMLVGASELLSRGDIFLNGQTADESWSSYTPSIYQYVLRFKIVDGSTGEAHYVFSHYLNDSQYLQESYFWEDNNDVVSFHHGTDYPSATFYRGTSPYSWIAYPDTRCKEVEIFFFSEAGAFNQAKKVPMKPHPYLECAYAFLGFGVQLRDILSLSWSDKFADGSQSDLNMPENRAVDAYNKIYLSEFENPFLFPVSNIITFTDKLVGAATTSVPLSEGQFGEFPMYVFTEGGIRTMIPTSEATFAATMAHPQLSRHIALPGTILSIEQAVIFITKRGVMLLSGGSVQELSREMNGKPFVMAEAIRNSICASGSTWENLESALVDSTTFMSFMEGANIAYDSNGARFIFFNAERYYQYVYMLETQTWHKTHIAEGFNKVLNSYPDCLVTANYQNANKVLNFSTILDDASILSDTPGASNTPPQPTPGIIVTRPFTLGEPDIRKAIRSIRVRGRFNRNDVQYILLGSFDNIHWHWMKSLRGGSYKTFRIILLTNLMAMERITWIDVDYESRFTNRLR